jgi:hypothetical protein
MGSVLGWITNMSLSFYMFALLGIWLFIDAVSWLDPRWSRMVLDHLDEQALAEAAVILSETTDEVRNQVTQSNA